MPRDVKSRGYGRKLPRRNVYRAPRAPRRPRRVPFRLVDPIRPSRRQRRRHPRYTRYIRRSTRQLPRKTARAGHGRARPRVVPRGGAPSVRFERAFRGLLTPRQVSTLDVLGERGPYRYRPLTRPMPRLAKPKRKPSTLEMAVGLTGLFTGSGATTPATREAARNVGRDLVSLPANVVTSGYYTGRAGVKAAKGDTSEARRLWRTFKATDPVALAAQGKFAKASRAGLEHPVATALEVAAPFKGASRLGGRVARSRVAPASVRRAAALERPARRVPHTNVVEVRRYHPGLFGKRVQVQAERQGRAHAQRLRAKARDAEARGADAEYVQHLHSRANRRDPDFVPDRHVEHQVDVLVEGLGQSVRRPHRAQAARAVRQILPKRGRAAVSLVAQGIVSADRESLAGYLRQLEAEAPNLRGAAKVKANKRLQGQIRRVLSDPKVDMAHVERAARAYAGVSRTLEREVVGAKMLHPDEAEKARLKPYAVQHMGARHDPERGLVVPDHEIRVADRETLQGALQAVEHEADRHQANGDLATARQFREAAAKYQRQLDETQGPRGRITLEDMRPLSAAEIRSHMAGRGLDPEATAFVSHAPGRLGDRAFNVSGRKPQGIPTLSRTGEAVRQGTLDASPDRLVQQVVQHQGLVDASRTWGRFVDTFAVRGKDGGVLHTASKRDASRLARNIEAETGRPMRVVRLSPWGGREEQLAQLLEDADQHGYVGNKHPVSEAFIQAVDEAQTGAGPWAVVPDAAANRLAEHAGVYKTQGPLARTVTQAFRKTVLPLSIPWMTGNAVEGALRAAVAGAGPRSWLDFRRVYNQLAVGDPSRLRALRKLPEPRSGSLEEQLLHMVPGGHFGGTHDTLVHVSAQQFERSRLAPIAEAVAAVGRKPFPGGVGRLYGRYTDWMFGTVNAGIEGQFTRAMAGKHLRGLMNQDRRAPWDTAVEQAAKGITGTHEQVAMAKFVRRAYGQYDSMSPNMRRWVLNYTPFGAWTFNAMKFLYSVLPKDHPVLTGLLAANHQLSGDWRNQHGLDYWAGNAVPPFLQGSIPLPGGRHLRIARYTPFGVMSDPLDTVASNVLPQFGGALMAFRGLDWKGDPLKGSDGKPIADPLRLAGIAAREFAFATVPGIGLAARIADKGVRKVFNPVEPVAKKKGPSGGGSDFEKFKNQKEKKGPSEFEKFKQGQQGASIPFGPGSRISGNEPRSDSGFPPVSDNSRYWQQYAKLVRSGLRPPLYGFRANPLKAEARMRRYRHRRRRGSGGPPPLGGGAPILRRGYRRV